MVWTMNGDRKKFNLNFKNMSIGNFLKRLYTKIVKSGTL